MAIAVKVCLVGPERTGKSFLSKLLAEQSIPEEDMYQPTAGVR
jgi:nicotinamide riboside kinase